MLFGSVEKIVSFLVKSRSFLLSPDQSKCILLFIRCSPNHKSSSELYKLTSDLSFRLFSPFEKTSSHGVLKGDRGKARCGLTATGIPAAESGHQRPSAPERSHLLCPFISHWAQLDSPGGQCMHPGVRTVITIIAAPAMGQATCITYAALNTL